MNIKMSQYIDNILESKEKKIWEGKINRAVLTTFLAIGLAIIIIIASFFFFSKNINFSTDTIQVSRFLLGAGILILGLIIVLLNFFSNLVKEYAITNKRVIIKSGLIGTDYKSIYFEQINEILIDVGLIGKIFGTGNLKIDTGKTETYSSGSQTKIAGIQYPQIKTRTMYDILKNIDNPYDVYKLIQPSITGRKESLYSGRADRESNPNAYRKG